jgi:hypothetical protein
MLIIRIMIMDRNTDRDRDTNRNTDRDMNIGINIDLARILAGEYGNTQKFILRCMIPCRNFMRGMSDSPQKYV